jgi:hypothetical protein
MLLLERTLLEPDRVTRGATDCGVERRAGLGRTAIPDDFCLIPVLPERVCTRLADERPTVMRPTEVRRAGLRVLDERPLDERPMLDRDPPIALRLRDPDDRLIDLLREERLPRDEFPILRRLGPREDRTAERP